jgi:hypothetical protein
MRRSAQLCKHICGLCVFWWLVLLTPASIEAQRRGVTLTGTVNETVALSIAPNSSQSDVDVEAVSTGSSVRMTLSGTGVKSPVILVRLLVRSNIGFNISGILESKTVLVTQLSVISVRATGRLVSPEAIDNLEIPQEFDLRDQKDTDSSRESSILDASQPFLLLSGSRVSVGGTLESPNNALQVTVLIRIKSQSEGDWRFDLNFLCNKRAIEK